MTDKELENAKDFLGYIEKYNISKSDAIFLSEFYINKRKKMNFSEGSQYEQNQIVPVFKKYGISFLKRASVTIAIKKCSLLNESNFPYEQLPDSWKESEDTKNIEKEKVKKKEEVRLHIAHQKIKSLYEQYQNEDWILSAEQVKAKQESWIRNSNFKTKKHKEMMAQSAVWFGFQSGIVFFEKQFIVPFSFNDKYVSTVLDFEQIKELNIHESQLYHKSERGRLKLYNQEIHFFTKVFDTIKEQKNVLGDIITDLFYYKFGIEKRKMLTELDKDGNGEVDAAEGSVFDTLLLKHQKKFDKDTMKEFAKVGRYLIDKKNNIQSIFDSIKDTPNMAALHEYVGILQLEVKTYEAITGHGIAMMWALKENEKYIYGTIYESMDRINIFDSQWERDVSQKLTNIGDGLNALMYEIEASNRRIVNELSNLTYATEQGFSDLNSSITSELQSIDESVKFNNLLTGIQNIQMYTINKNTKSLRE